MKWQSNEKQLRIVEPQLIMRIRMMMMVIHYECHMYVDINNFAQNNASDVYDEPIIVHSHSGSYLAIESGPMAMSPERCRPFDVERIVLATVLVDNMRKS